MVFFSYRRAPIAHGEIVSHSGNMHLIPSSDDIKKEIEKAHKGSIVEFKGYLVNVSADDGWHWNTSQSRNDTGDGSCEVVWVKEFRILDM